MKQKRRRCYDTKNLRVNRVKKRNNNIPTLGTWEVVLHEFCIGSFFSCFHSLQFSAWRKKKSLSSTYRKLKNLKLKGNTKKQRGDFSHFDALNCKLAALFFFFPFCSLIVCFKTFSRLYCTVDEPDLAINMYKKHRQVSLWRLLSVLRPRISHPVTSQRCIWDFCLFSSTLFGR